MIRYYCDRCGKELKKGDHDRVCRYLNDIKVEVMVAVKGVWNAGHVCHKCVMEVLKYGER